MDRVGALLFGIAVGWIIYRTLRHREKAAAADVASVLGGIGGAAVSTLLRAGLFGWYSVGLFSGFFLYLVLASTLLRKPTWAFAFDLEDTGPVLKQTHRPLRSGRMTRPEPAPHRPSSSQTHAARASGSLRAG